jgi:HAMP domain-containing protein
MDQAQGAIDAARAAGADQYATTEYEAATSALQNANDAVAAGDYRLALNYALESREHAQNAARDTADTKARMRSELEHALADLDLRITQGKARIAAAERARVAARLLRQPAATLAEASGDVQKARDAVAAGDYLRAREALDGLKMRIDGALGEVGAATTSQSSRRRR